MFGKGMNVDLARLFRQSANFKLVVPAREFLTEVKPLS